MRKPVAMAIKQEPPGGGSSAMFVLCDDGSVFVRLMEEGQGWEPGIPPIPGTDAWEPVT